MSQLRFDADLLPRLEALYGTEDVLRRRRLVREALAATPGDSVLDVPAADRASTRPSCSTRRGR